MWGMQLWALSFCPGTGVDEGWTNPVKIQAKRSPENLPHLCVVAAGYYVSSNYKVQLAFRKGMLPPPHWKSQMSCCLPNGVFIWSRQIPKWRKCSWNGSVTSWVWPAFWVQKKMETITPHFLWLEELGVVQMVIWHFQFYVLLFKSSTSKQN